MPENRTCSLSIVHGSYDGVNLKYDLWPGKGRINLNYNCMTLTKSGTSITRITFVLIVHRWITEAANLYAEEHKLRILFLYKYPTFHLKLLTTPTLLMIEISSHPQSRPWCQMVQALMPDGAGLVCGEKVWCWNL